MRKSNQIKTGAVLSYVSILVNVIAGLLYTPWMVRQIGQTDYGIYTLANSLITIFLVDFGLSSATSRYVSKYIAEDNQEKADSFLGAIYKLYLLIDVVIFIALILVFFFVDKIYTNLTIEELEKFKLVYAIAALYSVVSFPCVTFNGILTAYEKFIQLKLADLIHRVLTVVMTVAALLCGRGLYSLVIVNAVTGTVTLLYKYAVIRKKTPVKVKFEKNHFSLYKDIFGFSLWITVASLAQRLIFNVTPSILGMVASTSAIAIFGIVITIEQYSYLLTTAINGMFLPKISRIYSGSDNDKDIMPLMIKVGKFQFALISLVICGFAVIGKDFIYLWMGENYQLAYYGALLTIIPGAFFTALQIADTAIIVQKKVHIHGIVTLIVGVFNVICSYILSSIWGVLGACLSIFLTYTIRVILYVIIYEKVIRLDMIKFVKQCYLRLLPTSVVTIVFGLLLNEIMASRNWYLLIIKGIIITVIYSVMIILTAIDKRSLINALKKAKAFFSK